MNVDTQAIREALAKATPGKWEVLAVGGDVISDKVVVYRAGISIAKGISSKADSLLIANAPEWLRQLLDENERLREEMNKYRNEAGNERKLSETIVAEREELIIENEQLKADKAAAVEALRWYADEVNHRYELYQVSRVFSDAGDRARETIKRLGERPKGFESTAIHEPKKEV